jgi:glycosyltransferase involved in cell wall biosynthesis
VFFVVARLPGDPSSEECEGFTVYRVPWRKGRTGLLLFWARLFLRLARLRNRYDVIHVHGPNLPNALIGVFGKVLRKETFVTITLADSDLAFRQRGRLFGRLERWCFRFFTGYVPISTKLVNELRELGISDRQISFIPYGVDTRVFQPPSSGLRDQYRRRLGLNGEKAVTFVGMVCKRKGVDVLVEAWRGVHQEWPGARLLLVGPTKGRREHFLDDSFTGALQEMIRSYHLQERICLTGETANVAEYLQATDIFVLPAESEGLPNVLLEAMACGLPCVATRISGSEDVISHGDTGFLVEYGDRSSLQEHILLLLRNENLCRQIGLNARRVIEENYALHRLAQDHELLYARRC